MSEHPYLHAADGGVHIDVHVQPGAHRPRVVGLHGDALKLAVAAPPVDGRANEAVVTTIATALGVAASTVTITRGATSRRKRVYVEGADVKSAGIALDQARSQAGRPGRR